MTRAADRGSTARYLTVILVAGIGVGAILRFVRLGGQSLWVDELLTIVNAHVGEPGILSWTVRNLQGPAVSLLTHYIARLSLSEVALRMPSAVAGLLIIPAMYFMGRELTDSRTALHTAFLAALSPIIIWYSQEVRGYAFVVLFAILSTYFLVRWAKRGGPCALALYAVFVFAGLVSNLSMAFLLAVHLLYILVERRRVRVLGWWLLAVAVVLVAFSPWLNEIAVRVQPERVVTGAAGEPLRGGSRLSVMAVPYAIFTFGVGYSVGPSPRELQTDRNGAIRRNLLYIGLAAVLLAVPLVIGVVSMARSNARLLAILLAYMALPTIAVVLLAMRNIKVFNPRYLLIALPAYLLIFGFGLARITSGRYRLYIIPLTALLAFSIVNYFTVPYYARDDLRSAAAAVASGYEERDVVVSIYSAEPLEFYLRDCAAVEVFSLDDISSPASMEARCAGLASAGERVWLSQCRQWQVDPDGVIRAWFDRHMELLREESYTGVRLCLYRERVSR